MSDVESLRRWLDLSRTAGRVVLRLTAPGSTDPVLAAAFARLEDGAWHPTAEEITEAAQSDAASYAGELAYTLTAQSECGRYSDRRRIPVRGGKTLASLTTTELDPERTTTAAAALGHSMRTNVALANILATMARDRDTNDRNIAELAIKYAKDRDVHNVRLQRLVDRRGSVEVELRKLDLEEKENEAFWKAIGSAVETAAPHLFAMLAPAMSPAKRDASNTATVEQCLAKMTQEEAETVLAVLGPALGATVLRARGPGAVALLYEAIAHVEDGPRMQLYAIFQAEKFRPLMAALQAEHLRRAKEAKAPKDDGAPPAPANGATNGGAS